MNLLNNKNRKDVKVPKELINTIKKISIEKETSIQKEVEKAIKLYIEGVEQNV